MMMDLTSNSFETICRLCLRGRELVPIRETIVEDIKVSYLIEYSVSLEVCCLKSKLPLDQIIILGFARRFNAFECLQQLPYRFIYSLQI